MPTHTFNIDFDLDDLTDQIQLPAGWEVVAKMGPSDLTELTVLGPDRKVALITIQHLDEEMFDDLAVWLGEED